MTGYAYGNTRLRARRTALLDPAWRLGLVGSDLRAVVAALQPTAYGGGDAEGAHAVLRRVREVARARRRDGCGFYADRAGQLVALLLLRRERATLLDLLRAARAAGEPARAAEPTPRLPESVISDVGAAPDLPAAAAVLARHDAPDEHTATAVRAAVSDLELHGDPAAFEEAVVLAHAAGAAAQLRSLGPRTPVADAVAAEVDADNVVALVRARQEGADTVPVLPGGRWTAAGLQPLLTAADPTRVAAVVSAARPGWRAALARWAEIPDALELQRDLETARYRSAQRLWTAGDPLGPSVPVAYLAAVDAEEHDLGLLVTAAAGRLPAAEARDRLWAA